MRKTQLILWSVICIFTMLTVAPANAGIFGPSPNDDIKLVIKVAKGENDPKLRDKIIVKGMNYIKDFVDLKAMVKAAYFMKTKYAVAQKKFSKIKDAKQLCKIAGYLVNGNTTAKRYREKILKKGLKHIRIYEELKDVMKKAEYNTTRNYFATEKFIKVKDVEQLISIARLLRNEYYNDGSMKAAYRDKYLLKGAKTKRIAKTKADVIQIAGAAQTDRYQEKILRVDPTSSSNSGGSSGGGSYEPTPAPTPYPGEGEIGEGGESYDDGYFRTRSANKISQKCPMCNGTGKMGLRTCPMCHGAGWTGPMKGNHSGCTGGSCPMPGTGDDPEDKGGPYPGGSCYPPGEDPGQGGSCDEPGHAEDDKCGGSCGGCENPCPGGEEPGQGEDDKCGGSCGGCENPCPGGEEPGQGEDDKSAYDDPYLEEALKARILRNDDDGQARKLLLEIFRKRQ